MDRKIDGKILKKLIDSETIQQKVRELAKEITIDYRDKNPLLICTLKGATMFLSDLIRNVNMDFEIDYIWISSYEDDASSQDVELIYDSITPVKDRHILLIDDIVDTGLSFTYLKNHFLSLNPLSLKFCVLIDKLHRRLIECDMNYRGFEVKQGFLVGYGMDYNELGRNYPDIYIMV